MIVCNATCQYDGKVIVETLKSMLEDETIPISGRLVCPYSEIFKLSVKQYLPAQLDVLWSHDRKRGSFRTRLRAGSLGDCRC